MLPQIHIPITHHINRTDQAHAQNTHPPHTAILHEFIYHVIPHLLNEQRVQPQTEQQQKYLLVSEHAQLLPARVTLVFNEGDVKLHFIEAFPSQLGLQQAFS